MRLKHVVLIGLLGCLFVACDSKRGGGGGGDAKSPCDVQGECEQWTPEQVQACQDQADALETQANSAGCSAEFGDFVDCVSNDGVCTDGVFDTAACDARATTLLTCMSGNCSVANGTCDANCPPGTDPDCGSSCTADGFCDPACAPGLDPDCSGCVADGFCDPACGASDPDCGGGCDAPGSTCQTCNTCADSSTCSVEYNTCLNSNECISYNNCIAGCAQGDQTCITACDNAYPTGSQQFLAYAYCVVCTACFVSCDGVNSGC